MTRPDPKAGWWARLRADWRRNDGQPREQWAGGRDLKHKVLMAVLAVTSAVSIVGAVWLTFSR